MNARRFLPGLFVLLLVSACGGSAKPETHGWKKGTYAIRLHRPAQVGDVFYASESGSEKKQVQVTAGGEKKPVDVESTEAMVQGTVTVTAVTPRGKVLRMRVEVDESMVRINGGDPQDIAPKGSVLFVSKIPEAPAGQSAAVMGKPFSLEAGELSPEALKGLELVFSPTVSEETDDESFGINEPVEIEQRWPVSESVYHTIRKPFGLTPTKATGEVMLVEAAQVDGAEWLTVGSEIELEGPAQLQPDFQTEMRVNVGLMARMPSDTDARNARDSLTEMSVQAIMVNVEKGVRVDMLIERSTESVNRPIE